MYFWPKFNTNFVMCINKRDEFLWDFHIWYGYNNPYNHKERDESSSLELVVPRVREKWMPRKKHNFSAFLPCQKSKVPVSSAHSIFFSSYNLLYNQNMCWSSLSRGLLDPRGTGTNRNPCSTRNMSDKHRE